MCEQPRAGRPTVHDLRRRWKPQKERLGEGRPDHPTLIRFHRACSWLACAETLDLDQNSDLALISQWISLNAIYGQWDQIAREPLPDRECWRVFVQRIVELDQSGHLARALVSEKRLVLTVLDDRYLSDCFWRDDDSSGPQGKYKEKQRAHAWFAKEDWKLITERLIERIYLVRCQLVHGAATYGGKLNRRSLKNCATMLSHLLPAVLLVLIDHGADEDWGIMCYPPL
ncbi:MAG: hypothetical protein FJ276_16765 [Planctomycetes bacterium]|nr:hypothetical protein [Planctomycetota bacterium]